MFPSLSERGYDVELGEQKGGPEQLLPHGAKRLNSPFSEKQWGWGDTKGKV